MGNPEGCFFSGRISGSRLWITEYLPQNLPDVNVFIYFPLTRAHKLFLYFNYPDITHNLYHLVPVDTLKEKLNILFLC